MKIAVCLSGQLRTGAMCVKRIKDFFSLHDVDYFMHTWNEEENYLRAKHKKRFGERLPINHDDYQKIIDTLEPKAALKETQILFEFPVTQSQQYSFAKSNELRQKSNNRYDVVVKCRFDLIWHPGLTFYLPEELHDNTLYASHVDFKRCPPIVLDRFFFGVPQVIDKIASIEDYTAQKLNDSKKLSWQVDRFKGLYPEEILFEYLNKNRIIIGNNQRCETIVRAACRHLDVEKDFDMIRSIESEYYK